MKTEQSPQNSMFPAERSQSEVDACLSDKATNAFLPAGVIQVPKDELQRFLKCKRVGNYLLGKTIGEGSFARVKQGFHVLAGEKVAVKIIDKKKAHQDKYVSRNMRREAKIMQMVRHPHIVQLLEVVETEHRYYLITELAAGGDLMEYICYRRKLGELEVRKFMRQIVSAVYYLHQGGIIHRDLKVENLLLDEGFNIKIIDFGLSNTFHVRTSEGRLSTEHLRTQCGSPAYAAPEILGHKPYGPEVDAWSIGVNMFAMLAGKLPYTAEPFNITCLYNKMKRKDMNIIPDHLSTSCKDLIQRFLTFHPEKRITLEEALSHDWLQKGYDEVVIPITFPNYPREDDLNKSVTQHMVNKMEFNQQEIVEAVTQNRATSVSTVYHLLCRKLIKHNIELPGKMNAIKEARPNNSARKKTTSTVERRPRSPDSWRKTKEINFSEENEQTAVVSSLNVWNSKGKENMDEDLCKLNQEHDVPACRARLSSPSREDLSEGNVSDSNEISKVTDSQMTENVDNEPREDQSDEQKERSCSLSSETGLEISRKISCNCSSVEVMNMNGRKLSFNMSHISIESKSTAANEKPRNTSLKISSLNNMAHHRLLETGSSKVSLTLLDAMTHDDICCKEHNVKRSSKAHPKEMSIGKVSTINARIISIPLTPVKRNSGDKKSQFRRFSFPHTSLPSSRPSLKSLQTNPQPVLSPFSVNWSKGSSPTNEKRTHGLSFPPYGLCCQLTGVKHRVVEPLEHFEDHKQSALHQKHPLAVSGGQELLTSINNTLSKLTELSETETSKSKDCLLLRSRLPRSILNASSEAGEVLKVAKTALHPGNIGVERTKEKRPETLKISCSVKDSHSKVSTTLPNPARATSFDSKQQMHVKNMEKDARKRHSKTQQKNERKQKPSNWSAQSTI